jgi:tetratricopeptide (TPR) repeat protein
MKKDSVTASIISICLMGLGILIFMDILPFLFVWASLVATNNDDVILLQEKSIKTSVFKFQKIYTRNSAISGLFLMKDYDKVIEYYKDLEEMDAVEPWNTTLVIMAYLNSGDMDNALKYAKASGNKNLLARVYVKTKDFEKAKPIVEDILSKKPTISAYLYKAEILISENRWNEAEKYIDKALKISPKYIDALYLKAKILNKYGKNEEAKKYISRAKAQELKRSNLNR